MKLDPAGAPEMSPPRWYLAAADWSPDQPNPFRLDGAYGSGWSCWRLIPEEGDQVRNGLHPTGIYAVTLAQHVPHLLQRLADFLRYELGRGRSVIVAGLPQRLVLEALVMCPGPETVRPEDARWLVHSTSEQAWELIQECGELRAHRLQDCAQARSLGELLVGDPPEYAEYVALAPLETLGPEFVQACRQAGTMLPSPECEYQPGVRLYFDAHRIIRDRLAVRDGLHTLKVHQRLPLVPYLVAAIGIDNVAPPSPGEGWTTTLFRDRANEVFRQRVG